MYNKEQTDKILHVPSTLFFYNSLFTTLCWILLTCHLLVNSRKIKFLRKIVVPPDLRQPSVAIIIAARNEEAELEKALNTVCNINYSNYKIIVVNDRSSDNTALILEYFSKKFQHLKVIHVDDLPKGWIAKSYALYTGFSHSNEEYILFTDADVSFKPDTLDKAVAFTLQNKLDHLVVLPEIKSRSKLLNAVLATFNIMFDFQYKPWLISNPNSSACLGIGAFNFVRKEAYEIAGTHKRIALHPNDDMQLGYCIKSAGFKQDVLYGEGQVKYEWYSSLQQFVQGLMKNAFSSVNYNFLNAVLNSLGAFVFFVLPVPVLLIARNPYYLLFAAIIVIAQLVLYFFKPAANAKWWYVLIIPFSAIVIIFIMLRSAILALTQGGIYWSGNFYPLQELKRFNEEKY